jgi:hypothetical protein
MRIPVFREVAVLLMIMIAPMLGLAQSSGFGVTPIVKRGDPVSDGGRFFDCGDCEGRVAGLHAFNKRGDVAISADVVSGTCFTNNFLISGPESIRLANFCHTTEFGQLTYLGPVNINDAGQAALNAGITIDNRIVEMLLLFSEGRLTRIVQEGDISPIGTIFKGCGFGPPAINNTGEIAFHACAETTQGFFNDGVFIHSSGELRKVVTSGDATPIGGEFVINFLPAQPVQINDNGEVLFRASVLLDPMTQKFGLFLATDEGIKKIELDGEQMPGGQVIKKGSFGIGDLNDKGDVAFVVGLAGQSDGGIFLHSRGNISKVVMAGDPSPMGGTFSPFDRGSGEPFPLPHINGNGAVAFKAFVSDGSAPSGLFLASTKAIVKVVAVGDRLPTGEKIRAIDTFALNDLGQVAFFAYGKKDKTKPLGVYLTTPVAPAISSIKVKRKKGSLELRANGSAMITNDTVIEVNGVSLDANDYPSDFRGDGGFTTRVISRDARLEQLIAAGQTVHVTVFNSLTNLRSAPVSLTR